MCDAQHFHFLLTGMKVVAFVEYNSSQFFVSWKCTQDCSSCACQPLHLPCACCCAQTAGRPHRSLSSPIKFDLKELPLPSLESDVSKAFNPPESMAGGVAVFDYNGDGRPDIFFTNGADLATLKKSSTKFSNRLFRNDGKGVFTDVTGQAGLTGTGFDDGVAAGDYDNDGHPDLFVAGVHPVPYALSQQRRQHLHGCHGRGAGLD